MQAASQSLNLRRNALDVASAGHASAAPPSGGQYLQDLGSLQSSIRGASVQDLKDPDSECRIAIDVLVNFAAAAGPTGANARTALCDVYIDTIGPEKRNALLNAAHEMTQHKFLAEDTANLSVTVAFMSALSSPPPDGKNGPGHIDAASTLLAGKLGWPLDREPNLLAEDRAITDVELLAEGAALGNLNVWDRPISMDTPNAKEEFVALGHQALRNQQLATVWMPGNSGHHVAVVAEPVPSGIKFLVIAHPEDEHGKKMEAALKEFFSDGPYTVSRYEVELPHMALSHLNDNVADDRGAGGVIQEHADNWKSLNPEDQQAVTLVGQAKLFEAVAASASRSPAQVPTATPEVALPVPPARAKSLEENFNKQELTVGSGRVHSGIDGIAEIFSLKEAIKLAPNDVQLMMTYMTKLNEQQAAPERQNFFGPALAFVNGFNEGKAPLLFKNVDPLGPLASISKTLHGVGSGRKIIDLMVKHQQTLLQECRDAKDLSQLKNKLEEVVEVQAMLLGGINTAIADLEKFESEDLTSLNPEIAAQAKAQAKDLLAVSKRYRECLTGENSAEGNVYADFVAFAKQATTFGPSLEAAQAMFKGIGSNPRTVATPATAQQRPALEIDVPTTPTAGSTAKTDATMPASVATSVLTRAELKAMASAGGFVRDKITERPTNVWFDISETMNVHMTARSHDGKKGVTAGFLERRRLSDERRRLSDDVERRLNEMPDSNKRLTTAVMKAGPVPLSLDKSPLWAHLDKVRDAASGADSRVYVDTKELLKEGVKVLGQAQATLSGKGQALVAISAQLLARLALLSTEITKAALVTSKDPNDKNHWLFKESLLELQNWLGREVTKIDKAISELDAVLVPNAKGVTTRMRVDANTLRNALVALQSEYKDPAGVVQQAIGFTRASLASPENLQQAADALIG